jgi:hypothetical protein
MEHLFIQLVLDLFCSPSPSEAGNGIRLDVRARHTALACLLCLSLSPLRDLSWFPAHHDSIFNRRDLIGA